MANAKIINYGQPIGAGSTAIPDNTAVALDIESTDAKDYITIDTSDGAEDITIKGGGDSLISVYDKGVTMTGKGGTTGGSPNDLEDVVLYVENSTANAAGAAVVEINSDGNNSGVWFSESDALKGFVGTIEGHLYVNTNTAAGDLILRGNGAERMRIDADVGATKVTGPGGSTSFSIPATNTALLLENHTGSSATKCQLDINSSGAGGAQVRFFTAGTEYAGIVSTATDLTLKTERGNDPIVLSPHGTGGVGIGTGSPSNSVHIAGGTDMGLRIDNGTNKRILFADNSGGGGGAYLQMIDGSNAENVNLRAYASSYFKHGLTIGDSTLDGSALVELTSTSEGFLPPRMTTTQRDAISSPAEGLVVYNTSTKVLNFHNGTAWGAV